MILSTIASTAQYYCHFCNHNECNNHHNNHHHPRLYQNNDSSSCTDETTSCKRRRRRTNSSSSTTTNCGRPRFSMRHNNFGMDLNAEIKSARRQRQSGAILPAVVLVSLVLATIAANRAAQAFPSGAPEQACKDLKPGHGVEPASSSSPFELTQDKLQVEAGDQIKVTLSSPSKTNFKGLIVQALNEKGEPKGKFLPGKGLKTLDSCSAVTHSDREAKKTATLVWEAPSELKAKEAFVFKATVVQKFDEFHMNIKSTLATSAASASASATTTSRRR